MSNSAEWREDLSQTVQLEELMKHIQTRESLQLNQARDEPAALRANSKIDDQKIWMLRLVRHFQASGNGVARVPRELRSFASAPQSLARRA